MHLIDTHAHLDQVENLGQALTAAKAAGVNGIIAVGSDLAANKKNLEIKRSVNEPKIYIAFGIHPGNIQMAVIEETLQWIRENIHEAVAVGETGLDYWYKWVKKDEDKREEERMVFQKQLELAKEFHLPVILHSRGAWQDCLTMTQESGIGKALFHWYSGPVDILEKILEAGYYISASPSLAYSSHSREAIRRAPIERTLLETDTPVFYNDPDGGFQAQPKDVVRTLKAYCALKNLEETDALAVLNRNAQEFFGLMGAT